MGVVARAFWLTLLAYVIVAAVLIAKTGGPTAPSESVSSSLPSAGNATSGANATTGGPLANTTSGGANAENLTNDVDQAPGALNGTSST